MASPGVKGNEGGDMVYADFAYSNVNDLQQIVDVNGTKYWFLSLGGNARDGIILAPVIEKSYIQSVDGHYASVSHDGAIATQQIVQPEWWGVSKYIEQDTSTADYVAFSTPLTQRYSNIRLSVTGSAGAYVSIDGEDDSFRVDPDEPIQLPNVKIPAGTQFYSKRTAAQGFTLLKVTVW